MTEIRMQHKTRLSADEIKKKMNGFIEKTLGEFNAKISDTEKQWEKNTLSFSFKTKGMRVSGKVFIEDRLITVEVTIPRVACIFKNKIVNRFNKEAKTLFP